MDSALDVGFFIVFVIILTAYTVGAILAMRWVADWLLGGRSR